MSIRSLLSKTKKNRFAHDVETVAMAIESASQFGSQMPTPEQVKETKAAIEKSIRHENFVESVGDAIAILNMLTNPGRDERRCYSDFAKEVTKLCVEQIAKFEKEMNGQN